MPDKIEKPLVSVVIPAYNEAFTIESVVSETRKTLESLNVPYEIIVVDDGSRDLTGQLAEEKGARVVFLRDNLGKGHALRAGFSQARGDLIVTLDASGTNEPREIAHLITPLMKGADMVLGTRFSEGSDVRPYAIDRINFLGNKILTLMVTLLSGKDITDSQTSFRAFRSNMLRQLNIKSESFEIESELTVKALRQGFVFEEIPVTACPRLTYHTRKMNIFRDGFDIMKTILISWIHPKGEEFG